MAVSEFLSCGAENAIRGRDLAQLLHVDRRTLRQMIQRERLQGCPILSASDRFSGGYYLPADDEEVRRFLSEVDARIRALRQVREAVAVGARLWRCFMDG